MSSMRTEHSESCLMTTSPRKLVPVLSTKLRHGEKTITESASLMRSSPRTRSLLVPLMRLVDSHPRSQSTRVSTSRRQTVRSSGICRRRAGLLSRVISPIVIPSAGGEFPSRIKGYQADDRSGTPLIYRAIPSWFVRVAHMSDQLVANNEKTRWYVMTYHEREPC